MIGQRTRAALEREKIADAARHQGTRVRSSDGKLSEADWQEMAGRLRARASGLMRQLDAGSGYREQIERDLAKRMSATAGKTPDPQGPPRAKPCTDCMTANDPDARFCKTCGNKLDKTACESFPLCPWCLLVEALVRCAAPDARPVSRWPAFRGRHGSAERRSVRPLDSRDLSNNHQPPGQPAHRIEGADRQDRRHGSRQNSGTSPRERPSRRQPTSTAASRVAGVPGAVAGGIRLLLVAPISPRARRPSRPRRRHGVVVIGSRSRIS